MREQFEGLSLFFVIIICMKKQLFGYEYCVYVVTQNVNVATHKKLFWIQVNFSKLSNCKKMQSIIHGGCAGWMLCLP